MARHRHRPYRHRAVHVPFVAADSAHQWSSNDSIPADGFLFVDNLGFWTFLVQSLRTGDLYINKVTRPDPGRPEVVDDCAAEELRISTAPVAKGHLLGPLLVRGVIRTYFRELVLWQKIKDSTYSCYFKYYNGGTLSDLIAYYKQNLRKVPEHFIWHVLLTLIEAVRYLQRGVLPGTDNEVDEWNPIYNRALSETNIFLHYSHPLDSKSGSSEGFQSNAFPEVIIGSFGRGAITRADDQRTPPRSQFKRDDVVKHSEDVDNIFSVLKSLCIGHESGQYRDCIQAPESISHDRPYSDDLMNILRCGESGITQRTNTQKKNSDYRMNKFTSLPGLDYLVDTVLPLAKAKVRRYRRPGGAIPDDWYRKLDVSWTKPSRVMPYEWWPLPENAVDGTVNETVSPQHRPFSSGGVEGHSGRGSHSPSDSSKENVPAIDNSEGTPRSDQTNNSQSHHWSSSSPFNRDKENADQMNLEEEAAGIGYVNDCQSLDEEMDIQDEGTVEGLERDDEEATTIHEPDHTCPEPNPLSNTVKLNGLKTLTKFYPDIRPPYRLVVLEYQSPSMSEIRDTSSLSRPDTPESPSPTPPPQRSVRSAHTTTESDSAALRLVSTGSSNFSELSSSSSSSSGSSGDPEESLQRQPSARVRAMRGRQARGRGRGQARARGRGRRRGSGRQRPGRGGAENDEDERLEVIDEDSSGVNNSDTGSDDATGRRNPRRKKRFTGTYM